LLYPEMQGFVRDKIIDHLLDVYSSNYAEIDVAGVLMRAVRLPNTLFTILDQVRYVVAPYLIVYIITIAYISCYDWFLGVIVLVALLILFYVVFMSPKACEEAAYETERKSNQIADEMEDVFNNMISVYSQNQQNSEKSNLQKQHISFVGQQREMASCIYRMKFIMFPFMAAFFSLFVYRCYILVKKKRIDAGRFVALFMILTYVSNSMWRVINQMRDTIPRWGRVKEAMTIFDVPNKTDLQHCPLSTKNIQPKENGIYFSNVFFRYPQSDLYILKNLNFVIPEKQKVAIIGRIGCGKSTLLKLIMKYYIPSHGQILWNGISYENMTADQVRAQVGYVHQYPTLFKRSIYDNITYGLDKTYITRDAIHDILHHIGMEAIFDNIPQGLDGNVGRKGSKLSGGQRQMVWLLRTFFKNPDILILDEPTASVDVETKAAIQKMLELVMRDKTVIIVTHDKFLLDYVDRVITLENGKINSDKPLQNMKHQYML